MVTGGSDPDRPDRSGGRAAGERRRPRRGWLRRRLFLRGRLPRRHRDLPSGKQLVDGRGPVPGARFGAVAARLGDGDVLVTGGASSTGGYTADTEIYHPSSNSWSQAAPLPGGGVGGVAAPLPNGAVLVTGGVQNFSHDPAASSEIYDSTTHSSTPGFESRPPTPAGSRRRFSTATCSSPADRIATAT